MEKQKDYTTIDRPYNSFLERSILDLDRSLLNVGTEPDTSNNQTASSGGSTGSNGSVETMPVKSDGAIGDIWIKNFIRSENWKPKSVGFAIDGQTGYAEFMNVYVSGNIQALTGAIGGWVINATSLTDTAGTTGMSSAVTGGDDYRFWAGDTVPANAEFSVTEAGVIKATSGTIGGNILSATSISSTTFVSGPLGSGWQIVNTGTAEFQDVTIRGTIRTSVFEKDTISAVNGMVLISKADVLASDMTAFDASTLIISGQTTFVANEVIRIKDGTDDEWMLVTSAASAPTYTITRDLAGSYAPNTNPIWKKGTAVVSMGVGTGTKTGFVLLDSSSANSPYIDVYGRNSNTYSDYTLHGRFGWLKGITDADVGLAATDVWGLYTDNAYLKGVIVANTGYIGGVTGWVIAANTIKDVAGLVGLSNVVTAGDDIRFWAGHVTPASAPFYVTEAGALVATSATISGAITATSGTIGGFTISATSLISGSGAATVGLDNTVTAGDDVRIYAGSATVASAPFRVTEAGVLVATNATITGTIQTATSGKRIVISASTNDIKFYDVTAQSIGIGTTAAVAIVIDGNATTTNGVRFNASQASDIGFEYRATGNYDSTGINLQLTGATNSGTGINIAHSGSSGEGIYMTPTNAAKGLYIVNTGTALSLHITSSNGQLGWFVASNAHTCLELEATSNAAENTSGAPLLVIQNGTTSMIATGVAGCYLTKGGVWTDTSSREMKENFKDITVLDKIKNLDILQYNYISENKNKKHISPMAEDFQRIFGIGDGAGLASKDIAGIALQAIKELSKEVDLLKSKM